MDRPMFVGSQLWGVRSHLLRACVLLSCWTAITRAAYVEFSNCLPSNVIKSDPQLLQFVPLNVSVFFDANADNQPINLTVYGNVTGKATDEVYPPPSDPSWNDSSSLFGKIPDFVPGYTARTTLLGRFNVLSYTPYTVEPVRFCNATTQGECPLGPSFFASRYDLNELSAFEVNAQLNSSYSFTTLNAQLRILAGDIGASPYGCIQASFTPDLGGMLNDLLRYLPLAILIMVGVATVAAAIWSPWGSSDIFHWTSNFGRDEDLLRLVTPGFADCLQYIQFVVLTGSLTLKYPGFYQPIVSRASWSALMFNESLVTDTYFTPVEDGVYQYGNSSVYGLDRMTHLVGMGSSRDTWAGMITWLVILVVATAVLTQIGFAARWAYRQIAKIDTEDLRSKNGPFTAGNCIRLCLNYFILPLTAISFYQLVKASTGPSYSVAIAAIVLVVTILFSVRLFFLFLRTKPRAFLFDDLITVLAYGPLYNTYCDDAAMFALMPIGVNFLRGIAIGAVQPSGVVQVVLLAICEIINIVTLNAFRPYPTATSMNIYHTSFAVIRFITILLSIAFVPSLDVDPAARGWIGYAILLIHACVLVFGFFLNAIQTLVEVIARMAGAGGHEGDGSAARGGLVKVFGMRQLSRRTPRHAGQAPTRESMASHAGMLERMSTDPKDLHMARSRTRSVSASSTMLLQQQARENRARMSQNLDGLSGGNTPDTSSVMSKRLTNRFSSQSGGGIINLQPTVEKKDPYYRPPRRNTMDALNSPDKQHSSMDWSSPKAGLMADEDAVADDDAGEGTSHIGRHERDEFEDAPVDSSDPAKDYAVREVDFYYGVRGPALSSGTRKLKTGPADPTGPVSSASGWFKNLLGGKTKEKHKGFEVVRSARAPPPGLMPPQAAAADPERDGHEPYRDSVQTPLQTPNAVRTARSMTDMQQQASQKRRAVDDPDDDDSSASSLSDEEDLTSSPITARPPSLPLINAPGAIELPSRFGSEKSRRSRKAQKRSSNDPDAPAVPAIPRKSSRRHSSRDLDSPPLSSMPQATRLAPVQGSPNDKRSSRATAASSSTTARLPFANSTSATSSLQPSPSKPSRTTANDNRLSTGADSLASDYTPVPSPEPANNQENIAPFHHSATQPQASSSHARHSSSALGSHHAPDVGRPSSIGYVAQHPHIHHAPNAHESPVEFEGSVAEVLEGPQPPFIEKW
ncbi:uncharacterized protein AB675_3927 [Cyphellophora attinorum]|uniref:Putative membrane protein n=1 Tax=Cyphellophora attinorum TaxID=1664694 RepID=A0A0N0NK41_9EURO|nr:uncharacterized protein AB675_3927 [Phialophora attinorum]KPI37608.1 putative membrane protein [Phialophora attinorum]